MRFALVLLIGILSFVHYRAFTQDELAPILNSAAEASSYPDSSLNILSTVRLNGRADSLGIEYYRLRGNAFYYKGILDSALVQYTTAIGLLDTTKCTDQVALISNALAVSLQRAALYKRSIHYYERALGCAEFRKDTLLKRKIYNNLSVLHREFGEYGKAKTYINRALMLIEQEHDLGAHASLYNSLGQVYLAEHELDSAQHYFEKSCSDRLQSDRKGQAICMNNLGYVSALKGEIPDAQQYYRQAASIREEIGDLFGSASIFINMAELALENEDFTEARLLIQNASILSNKVGAPQLTVRLLEVNSRLEERSGNPQQSLDLLRSASQLRDSLLAQENMQALAGAEYGIALAEAENQVKRIRNAEANRERIIKRQRLINLALAVAIALFIGLAALLLYQLRMLTNLRKELTNQRDKAEQRALQRRETLNAVVHELRTPMGAIIALSDMILAEKDPKEISDLSVLLKKSSDRLLSTTDNVLSFSRLENGDQEIVSMEENISEMMLELSSILEPQARAKKLEFTKNIEQDIVMRTDRSVLEIVLMNLIGNAIKYTKHGGVDVSLKRKGESIIFTVRDTGVGIAEDDQHKIFEPFYQSASGNSGEGGAGLGLSIVQYYTKLLGADLELQSQLGEGSTFKLVF